jgi:hypothetical protein
MKETPMTTTTKLSTTHGVLPGVAHLALDVADRTQSTVIAVLQDARVEVKAVFDHGIELAEKASASAFRFAKKLGQRVDESAAETLQNTERLLGGAVKSARETTRAAAELAQTAGNGIAGHAASA